MKLDFSVVHFYIMASIAKAFFKLVDNKVNGLITIEYTDNEFHLVLNHCSIGSMKFESQEDLEKFCKDGRRNWRFYRKVLFLYDPKHKYPLSPFNQELCNEFKKYQKGMDEVHKKSKEGQVRSEISKILNISPKFTKEELKRPYRRFMQQNHPDKNPHADKELVSRLNELITIFQTFKE